MLDSFADGGGGIQVAYSEWALDPTDDTLLNVSIHIGDVILNTVFSGIADPKTGEWTVDVDSFTFSDGTNVPETSAYYGVIDSLSSSNFSIFWDHYGNVPADVPSRVILAL